MFFLICLLTENLALGKPTAQSSTYNYNSTVRGVSGNAVDGNPDSDFENGHCSHTNATNSSWWQVDLGTNLVPVSEIHIVNRFTSTPSLQQRNKDYKITLGECIFRADSWCMFTWLCVSKIVSSIVNLFHKLLAVVASTILCTYTPSMGFKLYYLSVLNAIDENL